MKNRLQVVLGIILSIGSFIIIIFNSYNLYHNYNLSFLEILLTPNTYTIFILFVVNFLSIFNKRKIFKLFQFMMLSLCALISLYINLKIFIENGINIFPGDNIALLFCSLLIGVAYKYYENNAIIKSIISVMIVNLVIYLPYIGLSPNGVIIVIAFILFTLIGSIVVYFSLKEIKKNIIEKYKENHSISYDFKRFETMLEKHLSTEDKLVNINNKLFNKNNLLREENTLLKILIVKQYYSNT